MNDFKYPVSTDIDQAQLESLFGVKYYHKDLPAEHVAHSLDSYFYRVFHGEHRVKVEAGDCIYYLSDDRTTAILKRGKTTVKSLHFATIIRGYSPADKAGSIIEKMTLPYVNGCSSRQVFPPDRIGDPTLQLLTIPPYTAEQAHHIHSTVRAVHVISGLGYSRVGMKDQNISQELTPGMTCVLEKMCPHHFETKGSSLVVMPVHVWSAAPNGLEYNHPMFNGTFLMNQGA